MDQLHERHRVAVAEVDHHDLWQRAAIGVVAVASQNGQVERVLHTVVRTLDADDGFELLSTTQWHLEES